MAATDLVIDANVIVKWFVDEIGSEIARGILVSSRNLLVPAHALAEIGEVLTRYRRNKKVTGDQLTQITAVLPDLLRSLPLDGLLAAALEVAWMTGASVYDGLYIAAAAQAQTILVTADNRLLRLLFRTEWSRFAVALDGWPAEQTLK